MILSVFFGLKTEKLCIHENFLLSIITESSTSQPTGDNVDNQKRDELIFSLIQKRMDGEMERKNALDEKANNMVGFISIITGIFLGAGILGQSSPISLPLWSYFLGVSILAASLVLSLFAFRIQHWIGAPDVDRLLSHYTTRPYVEVLRTSAATLADAVQKVAKVNEKKACRINVSWYLLVVGLMIIIIGIFAYNWEELIKPLTSATPGL